MKTFWAMVSAALVSLSAAAASAIEPIYTGTFSSTAVGGFDPVSYFSDAGPTRGSADLFRAEPEKYAPQYGGYCAYAVANGVTAPGDPEVWKIVDDKLYLNVNRSIANEWEKDIPGYVRKADQNWPRLLASE